MCNTHVHVNVTNNTKIKEKMGRTNNLKQNKLQSNIKNLLANDVIDKEMNVKLLKIIK